MDNSTASMRPTPPDGFSYDDAGSAAPSAAAAPASPSSPVLTRPTPPAGFSYEATPAAPAPQLTRPGLMDHVKQIAGGALQAVGSTISGAGRLADTPMPDMPGQSLLSPALLALNPHLPQSMQMAPQTLLHPEAALGAAVGNPITHLGDNVQGSESDAFKAAAAQPLFEGSLYQGSLLHPNTLRAGTLKLGAGATNPTAIAANVENLAGQAVPLLAGGIELKGAQAAEAIGSRVLPKLLENAPAWLQRGGAAVSKLATPQVAKTMGVGAAQFGEQAGAQEQQRIETMTPKQLADVPAYQQMVARGMTPAAAQQALAEQVHQTVFNQVAPLGAAAGVTSMLPLIEGGQGVLAKAVGTSRLKRAALGAGLEAPTQAGVGVALQSAQVNAANQITGENRDPMADSGAAAVTGAAMGAGFGLAGGLRGHGTTPSGEDVADAAGVPSLPPAPTDAAAPGSLTEAAQQIGGLRPNDAGAHAAGAPPLPSASDESTPAPSAPASLSAAPFDPSAQPAPTPTTLPWVDPVTGEVGTPTRDQLASALADHIAQTYQTQGHMRVNTNDLADAWGVPRGDISSLRQRATQMATQQVKDAARPPQATTDTTASMPFMITQGMKSELRALGHSDADISAMTPEQAHAVLSAGARVLGPARDLMGHDQPAADEALQQAADSADTDHAAATHDSAAAVDQPAPGEDTSLKIQEATHGDTSPEAVQDGTRQPGSAVVADETGSGSAAGEGGTGETAASQSPEEKAAPPRADSAAVDTPEPAPITETKTPPAGGVSVSGPATGDKSSPFAVSDAAKTAERARVKTGTGEINGRTYVDQLIAKGFNRAESIKSGDRMRHVLVRADGSKQPIPAAALRYAQETTTAKTATPTKAIDMAAHEAATSPHNDLPEPTQPQKEAGNYKMGHVAVQGMDISIENPRGSTRSGVGENGKPWSHVMSDHYGYVRGTVGADGDHVDVYVGSRPEAKRVYVVDQIDQKTGAFDEHKAMIGFRDQNSAMRAYRSNFDKGWKVGTVKDMPVDKFKDWLKNGDTTKPVQKHGAPAQAVKQPLTAGQKRSTELLGATTGDTIRTTGMGVEIQPGSVWHIDRIDKDGSVHTSSPAGGSSVFKRAELEREVRKGATFEKLTGSKETAAARPLFSKADPKDSEPFYSALTRSVDTAKGAPKTGDATAWTQWMDGAQRRGEFKQAEREWMGVDQWLSAQKGPVTHEQVQQFVRDNQVQVQETTLGGDGDGYMRDENGRRIEDGAGGFVERKQNGPTKFSHYQEPGGKNYKELLLTLPQKLTAEETISQQMRDKYGTGWLRAMDADDRAAYLKVATRSEPPPGNFESSHFEQPNILAHVRFNERTDADGKKVLFLEEVQSDWHQAGRKDGYVSRSALPAADVARFNELGKRQHDGETLSPSEQREFDDLDHRSLVHHSAMNVVPDAPFKKEWPMLAMKRMVRYAAENGFDRIAWTTGEQQAARYGLSKKIASIRLHDNGSGGIGKPRLEGPFESGRLYATDHSGNEIINHYVRDPDELPGLIGKEAAEKLLAQPGKAASEAGIGVRRRELSGLDLKLGGEGMTGFYDKMLPNEVNKWAKPFGGKVGDTHIDVQGRPEEGRGTATKYRYEGPTLTGEQVFNASKDAPAAAIERQLRDVAEIMKTGMPLKTAMERYGSISAARHIGGDLVAKDNVLDGVHSLDITPAMREAALGGLPMFRQGDSRDAATNVKATAEQVAHTAKINQIATAALGKWKGDDVPALRVVATPEQLPEFAKRGADGQPSNAYKNASGMYDGKSIYIVASKHSTDPAGMRKLLTTMAHEGVGHYGIDRIVHRELGADAWKKIESATERLRKNPELASKSIRDVIENVEERYRNEEGKPADAATFAREFLAVTAERGVKNGLLDRAIAAVRSFLRRVMPDLKLSEHELRQLLVKSDQYLQRGETYAQRVQAVQAMSFAKTTAADEYRAALSNAMKVSGGIDRQLPLGRTSDAMKAAGLADAPMFIKKDTVLKATRGDRQPQLRGQADVHDVALADIQRLPELLERPIMVFKSRTQPDSVVALTDAKDLSGRQVVVALHTNKSTGATEVHRVASVYGKDGVAGFVREDIAKGRLLYRDSEKSPAWIQSVGLQLPGEGAQRGSWNSVPTEVSSVKSIGAVDSATLSVTPETLRKMRGRFGSIEGWWKQQFGQGFDGLTETEAHAALAFDKGRLSPDGLRNRILAGKIPEIGRVGEAAVGDRPGTEASGYGGREAAGVDAAAAKPPRADFSKSPPRDTNVNDSGQRDEPGKRKPFSHAAESAETYDAIMPKLDDGPWQKAKDWMQGKLLDFEPKLLGALNLRHVTDLMRDIPELKRGATAYEDQFQAMSADNNKMKIGGAEKVKAVNDWAYEKGMVGWRGKLKAEAQQMFKFMHKVTQVGTDPTDVYQRLLMPSGHGELKPWTEDLRKQRMKMLKEQMLGRSGDDKTHMMDQLKELQQLPAREKARASRHPELVREWNALTPKAQEMFTMMRDHYKQQALDLEEAGHAAIEAMDIDDGSKRVLQLLNREKYSTYKIDGVYFPLQRFGDYWVGARSPEMRDKHGETVSGGDYVFRKYENAKAAIRGEKQYLVNGYTIESRGRQDKNFEKQKALSGTIMAEIQRALRDSHASEKAMDQVNQIFLKTLPELSLRKRGIHRFNVAGYTDNVPRVFASAVLHGSHQIAKARYGFQMRNTLDELKGTLDAKRMTSAMSVVSASHGDALLGELNKRNEWVMNPTSNKFTTALNALGFTYYMAASPASALVNLAQNPMITLPVLAARHGWPLAMKHLSSTVFDAIRTGGDMRKVLKNAEERAAYDALAEAGTFQRTATHTLGGIADDSALMMNPVWSKVTTAVGYAFQKSEVINRESAGIAAFRLARAEGQPMKDAIKYADEVVNGTHFDYSNANRSRMLQGDAGKLLGQFKSYSVGMSYLYLRTLDKALRGETPEVKRIARRTMAGILGMTTLFAGVMGTPVKNVIAAAADGYNAVFGDDNEPWDFDTEFRGWLADHLGSTAASLIADGAVNKLGANVSSRLSASDMWIRDSDQQLQGQEAWDNILEAIAGPLGGIGKNFFVGNQQINQGHMERGLETMLPTAVKNVMKSARYASEGVNTLQGAPIVDDISGPEAMIQAMGFQPTRVAEQQKQNSALYNAKDFVTQRRQSLLNGYAMAYTHGDADDVTQAREAIAAFNQKWPTVPISMMNLNESLRSRARAINESQNGVRLSGKLGAAVRAQMSSSGS